MASPLPNLKQLNQRLAENNSRVNQVVDALMSTVDALAAAASQREWNAVQRLTNELKRQGQLHGLGIVAEAADDVLRTLPSGNESESLRRVVRLIGAAGRAKPTGAKQA